MLVCSLWWLCTPISTGALSLDPAAHSRPQSLISPPLLFLTAPLVLCDDTRDGPAWARQRSCIQKLMMNPPSAAKFLEFQMPVARDFADVLGSVVDSDGVVPNLYDKLFQYTMECKH